MTIAHHDEDIDLALVARQHGLDPDPAAEFDCVVAFAEALTPDRADHYQKIYNRHWGSGINRAGTRAYKQLRRAGRLTVDVDDALDSLCGIVGGATDVALAVLARDLITAEDFERLTRWWRAAGLPLTGPTPVRYIRPAQRYVRAGRAALVVGVLILVGGLYAVNTGHLTPESKALPLLVAALILCGVISAMFNHRADVADTPAINIDQEV